MLSIQNDSLEAGFREKFDDCGRCNHGKDCDYRFTGAKAIRQEHGAYHTSSDAFRREV
jgi:hypothetical protein